jgi:two-component system NtrC family sensor kinase
VRHIVQDLKEFSRRDSGEATRADVNACLESTLQIVWPTMKHLVTLEKRYAELPPVRCYPMLLKQVLLNLLVNAHQAIEERIGGRSETGRIRLETRREGAAVVIAVADDGVGIPPENRDRIFDPFFTTKPVGAGTGLGLSISYQIVERHGGTLTARSEPGRGSTFEVRLPLAGPE